MPGRRRKPRGSAQHTLTHYLLRARDLDGMSQNGAAGRSKPPSPASSPGYPTVRTPPLDPSREYTASLTKLDLESSLEAMYARLATKFQTELHKTSHTLSQEIAALGSRTERLETEHDELALAYSDLSREHDSLATAFSQMQSQIEDLDNRNRRNNLRIRGIPESVTDLIPTIIRLFKSLLPDTDAGAFTCDRIHRALRPKPPDDKPPRDIVLCMKDFLIKEEILRAARNQQRITLDDRTIQIYPDISPATLDRRRGLKEITSALQAARIRYRWGFPFKLVIPHNGTTYSATSLLEGQEVLVKLGLLEPDVIRRPPSTPRPSPIWQTPPTRRDRRRIRYDIGDRLEDPFP